MIYFKDYEQYHATPGNKATHWIGVPTVMFSLLGLLSYVIFWGNDLFRIDLGLLLFIAGAIFAIRVDRKLAAPFLLFTYLNYLLARHLSIPVLIGIQVLGWTAQLIGHSVYEKKAPAFLTTLSHLFVGPMWIFAKAIGYYQP